MAMWLPLENNPAVMNAYVKMLGVAEPLLEFTDVFGTAEEHLAIVPQPVKAVLFVYPISKATEDYCRQKTEEQKEEAKEFVSKNKFFFTKQYVGNACGTIGMLHALINNVDALGVVSPNSVLAVLGGDAIPQSHKEVGVIVGGMEALNEAHAFAALQGDTAHQPIDTPINLHFVCFVGIGGRCLELDGRQDAPILHGNARTVQAFLRLLLRLSRNG
ncbi:ubiquitin carboxyl-terminal hydrolase L3 [Strigomonas culicis]|uniref:Ubiquitin carboxyl-terminal hydrolase n=1 Tax=Strigomonas culicis TaxID=28005 RepID=S9UPA3_9TRYP|nr:ubiquitin carboxyl-terminal hydrolase L3 [Strigomonas culicis]|eukprot:EPY30748.1 ubiquitin carboxyl-terminal hydrolase L3 [Strigomonas culicis]